VAIERAEEPGVACEKRSPGSLFDPGCSSLLRHFLTSPLFTEVRGSGILRNSPLQGKGAPQSRYSTLAPLTLTFGPQSAPWWLPP